MIVKSGVLEGLLFFLVVIYLSKVVVVMTYLDASREISPRPPSSLGNDNTYRKGRNDYGNPNVRSILQDNSNRIDTVGSNRKHLEDMVVPRRRPEMEKEEEKEEEEEEENDYAGMNAELFAKVLKQEFDHSSKCAEDNLFVIILINSKPQNLDFRMTIRETWANAPDAETQGVLSMFIMGKPMNRPDLETTLFQENERYDDIIQGNFIDDFRNASYKTLIGLKWVANHCSVAKFVFMGDDHMYVNLERLVKSLRLLHVQDGEKMWRGRVRRSSKAIREPSSRYYVASKLFNFAVYPPFCTLEAGFVMTMVVVHEIYREAWDRSILPFGDVFIGIIADEMKWDIIEDPLFNFKDYGKNVCDLSKMATLRGFSSPDSIRSAFDKLKNDTFLRNCPDPDLDLVLSDSANNQPYLDLVLKMVHDHPRFCYDLQGQKENVFMINLISTLPRHFESRQAIRKTWGSPNKVLGENIKTLFVMGLTQKDTEEIQKQVQIEDDTYGDIIQATFRESFQNLTLKVVLGLKWVSQNCAHATYVYKGDDDMFVNFANIINNIKTQRSSGEAFSKFFMGSVLYRSVRVTRHESKYFVNDKVYSGRYFPPYCSGGGYILSGDIVPLMYEQSLKTAFIPIDDAYQGILAKRVGVLPTYHNGFKNWGEKSDTCSLRKEDLMTIHGFKDPANMYEVWTNFTDTSVKCTSR